jgi:D-amino-acid dehydrogenase
MTDCIVLGAGIIGVSVAVHLQRRGRSVLLVDRREPGRETSYGNAGIIQREAVRPRAFPRSMRDLWRIAAGRGLEARYDLAALPGYAPALVRYWWQSAPARYRRIVAEYETLISRSLSEHADLIAAAGAEHLIEKKGFLLLFRTAASRDAAFADAAGDARRYGVGHERLDAAGLAGMEPALRIPFAGALHWTDPWTVRDPGALVTAYARLFERLGGTVALGDAGTLRQATAGWSLETAAGPVSGSEVVIALGPWTKEAALRLGYRLPLFIKRGYHREYQYMPGGVLNRPVLDFDVGYLLAPMRTGTRLTTGAEFARLAAPMNEAQLKGTEAVAREVVALGDPLEPAPWMGARPCTPDMKPIIGRAPGHENLWFAFGHCHQGLTLGPVTGRLIAEMMAGETPVIDPQPFAPERFLRPR